MPSMPNMQELMEKAKEMQQQMQQAQKEILMIEVVGQSGGGLVKIRMNGGHRALHVEIAPSLLHDDEETLEDLVMAAINHASDQIEKGTKDKMMSVAKALQLPADFDQGTTTT